MKESELTQSEYETVSKLKSALDLACKTLDELGALGITVQFNIHTPMGGTSTLETFELRRNVRVPFSPPARH